MVKWQQTAICQYCGREFPYSWRKNPKFCSKSCSMKHVWKKRKEREKRLERLEKEMQEGQST